MPKIFGVGSLRLISTGFEDIMTVNPYESYENAIEKDAALSERERVARWPLSLLLLTFFFFLTVVLAFINLVQEGAGYELGPAEIFANLMISGFSGLSQLPGLAIAGWRWKGSPNLFLPLLVAAYLVALTAAGEFFNFVLQTEPSDSVNSAAHMHIFLFPILHLVLSTVVYVLASVLTVGLMVYQRYITKR